jgi:hypothetical protein
MTNVTNDSSPVQGNPIGKINALSLLFTAIAFDCHQDDGRKDTGYFSNLKVFDRCVCISASRIIPKELE